MDHKALYAHHIAQAIKHKRMMAKGGEVEEMEPMVEEQDEFLAADAEPEEAAEPVDDKAKRKERIKAILAR